MRVRFGLLELVTMVNQGDNPVELNSEDRARLRQLEALMQERELAFSDEEKVVLKWKAAARPFKKRNREFFTTVGAIVILVSVILLFVREFLLIAVILSFAFVSYVLASVEPEEAEHIVTTRGVRTGGRFFRWDDLGRFWFEAKFNKKMVVIETLVSFPGRILMLVDKKEEEKLKKVLNKYLLNETPEPTFLDKSADWLSNKIPLES